MTFRKSILVLVAGFSLLAAACATLAAELAPTMLPAPSASPAGASALPAATEAAAVPAPTAGTAAASVPAVPPAMAGPISFNLAQAESVARFKVREQLAGYSLPSDAIGVTKVVSGVITLAPDGSVVPGQSRVAVDLRGLRSDSARRDTYIQRNTLETGRFPFTEFAPLAARGLPSPLPVSGTLKFQLYGDLTVHGVTRPVTWDVTAQATADEVRGTASTTSKLTDFSMTPPRAGPVLSVEDAVRLEIDFRATRRP